MNPKFHKYFMDVAHRTAELSPATRLKVGSVAVLDRRIIACGYNGTGPGEDNTCEDVLEDGTLVTKANVRHSERNLIDFANSNGISLRNCTLYITHKPCMFCASKIWNVGIREVIYDLDYREDLGRAYLQARGVVIKQFSELGL